MINKVFSFCSLNIYNQKPKSRFSLTSSQSQVIKAAGQGWFSGQIPADAQRNLIKGTMTEVVVSVKTNNSDSTKTICVGY